ncbi:MAG: hypothetical protein H8E21_14200 [Gammaproteobacteria bacterium]|nr:hypothetical protein [Gammaproteobacteria bacterium]MBL6998399.1 hypothetical protein [Gammaproteobacteria bacterium]
MNVAVLKTGLFPDAETVEQGVEHLYACCNVYVYDVTRHKLENDDWDKALDEMLAADRIIVV